MEKQQPGFDYEVLKKKTLEQFRSGKNLFGRSVYPFLYGVPEDYYFAFVISKCP